MKKITLFAFLLISSYLNAQTTYAVYTEDSTIGDGLEHLRFSNGQGFSYTEPTTSPYEGIENALLTFNGTSSYFHAIFLPRNSTDTADMTIDVSAYSYYNIALKTTSSTPFYIRMRGNGITAKVLIDPSSNGYSFSNDGQWHFMSIPFTDFIPESGSFSLTTITEILVLRSNASGSTTGLDNDFAFDDIYLSDQEILAVSDNINAVFTLYPNPTNSTFTIKALQHIDNVNIYDILGKEVVSLQPQTNIFTTDISSLTNGIYIVKVNSNGKSITKKLIKN